MGYFLQGAFREDYDGDMSSEHTYEVIVKKKGRAVVYTLPTTFSVRQELVTHGQRLRGHAVERGAQTWIELAGGGYILRSRVRVVVE